ncbi:MAG TPA: hypothetical protein VFR82_03705, partial [Nitrospira sp.]|nr:hypothetical protein [Nitrospira sp.]
VEPCVDYVPLSEQQRRFHSSWNFAVLRDSRPFWRELVEQAVDHKFVATVGTSRIVKTNVNAALVGLLI